MSNTNNPQAPRSLSRLVRRLVALWKSGLGICPTDGCWNDSGHVGCCPACWQGKSLNAQPSGGKEVST